MVRETLLARYRKKIDGFMKTFSDEQRKNLIREANLFKSMIQRYDEFDSDEHFHVVKFINAITAWDKEHQPSPEEVFRNKVKEFMGSISEEGRKGIQEAAKAAKSKISEYARQDARAAGQLDMLLKATLEEIKKEDDKHE